VTGRPRRLRPLGEQLVSSVWREAPKGDDTNLRHPTRGINRDFL
jgi:hypothetical protein